MLKKPLALIFFLLAGLFLPTHLPAQNSCLSYFHPYEEALSVVGVIKDSSGKVLILKRAAQDRSFPGKWSLPGGKIDPGETPEQAIIREVFEETGLRVEISKLSGLHESFLENRNRNYLIYSYDLKVITTKDPVVLSHEHEDFAWIRPQETNQFELAGQITFKIIQQQNPQHILITAGGTKEPLDDVRYLTNFSSGALGYALASEAAARGDLVTILAPKEFTKLNGPLPDGVRHVSFFSTQDLQSRLQELAQLQTWDLVFHTAAVSDYTVESVHKGKISSNEDKLQLTLVKTPKLIQEFRNLFGRTAFLVGFKLLSSQNNESSSNPYSSLLEAAFQQIRKCRTNMCVANLMEETSSKYQKIHLVTPEGGALPFAGDKTQVAKAILDFSKTRNFVSWFQTLQDFTLPSVDKNTLKPLLHFAHDANLLIDQNGNLSQRVPDNLFLISPRGVDKTKISVEDFAVAKVDIPNAKVLTSSLQKPSIDSAVSGMLYARYPNLQAIVHTHSKWFLGNTFKTQFPFPCGVKEEGLEIISTLKKNDYNEQDPFVVEMVHHGHILGLTAKLSIEKLNQQWLNTKKDIQQHWQEVRASSEDLAGSRLTALLSSEGVIGSVLIHPDGSVSPRLHPYFQGKGYGRQLVQKIVAEKLQIKTVAECEVEAFYAKNGFQIVKREGRFIWMAHP